MTPTLVDPSVYKLESERGVAKLSLSVVFLLACITSIAISMATDICLLDGFEHRYFPLFFPSFKADN